jgi:hypothetical protein
MRLVLHHYRVLLSSTSLGVGVLGVLLSSTSLGVGVLEVLVHQIHAVRLRLAGRRWNILWRWLRYVLRHFRSLVHLPWGRRPSDLPWLTDEVCDDASLVGEFVRGRGLPRGFARLPERSPVYAVELLRVREVLKKGLHSLAKKIYIQKNTKTRKTEKVLQTPYTHCDVHHILKGKTLEFACSW